MLTACKRKLLCHSVTQMIIARMDNGMVLATALASLWGACITGGGHQTHLKELRQAVSLHDGLSGQPVWKGALPTAANVGVLIKTIFQLLQVVDKFGIQSRQVTLFVLSSREMPRAFLRDLLLTGGSILAAAATAALLKWCPWWL